MGAAPLVRPIAGLLPIVDSREPLQVLIASLAPGGAERIVLEWLGAEASRGRAVELAVLHRRRQELRVPRGIAVRSRGDEPVAAFVARCVGSWQGGAAPVSCHLVPDAVLAMLWECGIATVPVVHNTGAGWRNDPAGWRAPHVPRVLACALQVAREVTASGCSAPVVAIRHRPAVAAMAFDPRQRERVRAELVISAATFVILAVGAIKPQKDYVRAIEVLARVARSRDAVLVIAGGVLADDGLAELDRVVDRALALGVSGRLRLPGFVDPIEPWLAAADAVLNVSRFEGLSIATQEALAAGLPVVATAVGGQAEIRHPAFHPVAPDAPPGGFAQLLAASPVRTTLERTPWQRTPREWSVAMHPRARRGPALGTLFVTANLNAGGAQRSLVNLAHAIAGCESIAIAVCGESTQREFIAALAAARIEAFRPAPDRDPCALAESILATVALRGARTVCLWNVDAPVKLLLAKHAPPTLRLVEASPGAYGFEELETAASFAEAIGFAAPHYHARLDLLVLKYRTVPHPTCRRVEVIENGVAATGLDWRAPPAPRFLVHGRIAPSKRLEAIIDAFAAVARDRHGAQLVIVGGAEPRHEGYLRELRARGQGLAVAWRGPDASLSCLRGAWTATVVLGTHQGSPNAVLEAMAAAVPVIANASGGTGPMLGDGTAGWLLPEDVGAKGLAVALEEAISMPERARAFAQAATRIVRDRYGLELMAGRYLAALRGEAGPGHEKLAPWNSATAPAAPARSPSAPSPAMPAR